MINIIRKRVAFATFFILLLTNSLFSSGFTIVSDEGIILDKAIAKMREMGDELYQKTKVSTIIVAKKHLDKKEFLDIKKKYMIKAQGPYVLWIFSKTYEDRSDIGLNQMFNSKDLDDKFDKDSLFSPFTGTFTKILTSHSKVDSTSAAFLNGYADLVDMFAKSYDVKLKSSIGSNSLIMADIVRYIVYSIFIFVILLFIREKLKK